tara:strand:- start:250 stop:570 length:321 start_codon:yes stop_codon:yes gene_type:complete
MKNKNKITSFKEFYPFYLSEHLHPICRLLHFLGTGGVICLIMLSIINSIHLWVYAPLFGYSFAWLGHFVFEKNKPATFMYPIYSLIADFVMFFDLLTRREKFNPSI